MSIDVLRVLKRGSRPFRLKLAGGRVVEVRDPLYFALSPVGSSIVCTDERDRIEVIRINQVIGVELTGDAPAA